MSQLDCGKELSMSIIRILNTVFIAIGICHTGYVDCLLARKGWNEFHPDLATRLMMDSKFVRNM
jgi:hypothetical protein